MTDYQPDPVITELSAALDEVFRLRRAAAYEAAVLRATLQYATFPKSRRPIAEQQVARLEAAARGDAATAYTDVKTWALRQALLDVGAPETLTRDQFAAEGDR